MASMVARRRVVSSCLVAAVLVGRAAVAQEDVVQARAAYDEGAKAYEAKQFARAAERFARADELSPDARALRYALAAALQSDDALLGATLAQRADERGPEGELGELARSAHGRFDGRIGRVRIICKADAACQASVLGKALAGGGVLLVEPGPIRVDFGTRRVVVQASPGRVVDAIEPPAILAPRPAPEEPAPAPSRSGLSPVIFWSGVVATGALAAVTVVSAADTVEKRDDFLNDRTPATRDPAQVSALRTNLLIAGTGVVAIATGICFFFTRWQERRR